LCHALSSFFREANPEAHEIKWVGEPALTKWIRRTFLVVLVNALLLAFLLLVIQQWVWKAGAVPLALGTQPNHI
jgi:hypothetical protein